MDLSFGDFLVRHSMTIIRTISSFSRSLAEVWAGSVAPEISLKVIARRIQHSCQTSRLDTRTLIITRDSSVEAKCAARSCRLAGVRSSRDFGKTILITGQ